MKTLATISTSPDEVRRTAEHEYVIRFVFGGVITAVIGVMARAFGPVVAGLFLAFPAILPASLTLMEEHDGQQAAATEAEGATLGSIGLIAFGLVVWRMAGQSPAWMVLSIATAVWFAVSAFLWFLLERRRERHRAG